MISEAPGQTQHMGFQFSALWARTRAHSPLILVLTIGLIVWLVVFGAAVSDYLDTAVWCRRSVWAGDGSFELFGLTIYYQLEGYADYSFYYVHWGHNMLLGVPLYTPEFGELTLNGVRNQNGIYIFPPLFAILCALGILLPVDDIGIGVLIAAFGYLTAVPVYGLGKELSGGNVRVGTAAAMTYLLSPAVLYHICFCWLNPSPFVFFFISGYYALVRGHKYLGTLLIVTAALFKQTAWFLGIVLVVELIVKRRHIPIADHNMEYLPTTTPSVDIRPGHENRLRAILTRTGIRIAESLDLRGFARSALLAAIYVSVITLPFMMTQPNMLGYMWVPSRGYPLDSLTELPAYSLPMRLQVLPVVAGIPALAMVLDYLVYNGILLVFGVSFISVAMFLEPRRLGQDVQYYRRLLFLAMMLMLWVHLVGPRGVYKYYFTLFAPFFSIFSSYQMVAGTKSQVEFSSSMLWMPMAVTLLYLLPNRLTYLLAVALIMIAYGVARYVGAFWHVLTTPCRLVVNRLRSHTLLISHKSTHEVPMAGSEPHV